MGMKSAWRGYENEDEPADLMQTFVKSMTESENYPPFPEATQKTIWEDVARTADEHNKPGRFSAFIGYEWTSLPDGNNLHRVVVYRDGADKAALLQPFTAQQSRDPRDLWRALETYEQKTGGKVLAIPHNGNLSNGRMFPIESLDGKRLNKDYAESRQRWEPIYEVTQVKGDGESHPLLSPNDEFADFENWSGNIGRSADNDEAMLPGSYARGALQRGLQLDRRLGVNPFKFGLVGSTDGHNSMSTPQEDNFFGKFPDSQPSAERTSNLMADAFWPNWKLVASGYAAVWATENTREALFDAMKRREVYATTGSRIMLRFFGGWDYAADLLSRPNYLDAAYGNGVPMGGDLSDAPQGQVSPSFAVLAVKDPDGANLDRIQIVKGWLDRSGELQERVHDVAWSGDRQPDPLTGKLPAVGSTVSVENASYTNTIGSVQLAVVWRDPDFDASTRAFYYVRVLEIPRPRWSTYDAAFFRLELPEEIPRIVQDRAYSSPIWFTP